MIQLVCTEIPSTFRCGSCHDMLPIIWAFCQSRCSVQLSICNYELELDALAITPKATNLLVIHDMESTTIVLVLFLAVPNHFDKRYVINRANEAFCFPNRRKSDTPQLQWNVVIELFFWILGLILLETEQEESLQTVRILLRCVWRWTSIKKWRKTRDGSVFKLMFRKHH